MGINGVNSNSNKLDPYTTTTKVNGNGNGKKDPPGQTKPPGPTTPPTPPPTPPTPPPTDPVIPPPVTPPPTEPPVTPPPTDPNPAPATPTTLGAKKPVAKEPVTFEIYDFKGNLTYKPPKVEEKKIEENVGENSVLRSAQKKLQTQENATKSQPANPRNMVQLLSLKIKSFVVSLLANQSVEPKAKPENGQPAPENNPKSSTRVAEGNNIKDIQSDFNNYLKDQVGHKDESEEDKQNINNPGAVNPNTKNSPLSHIDYLA